MFFHGTPPVAAFEKLQAEAVVWKCPIKKGVHRNFTNFTGKHLCWSFKALGLFFLYPLFYSLMPATLLKQSL